MIYFLIPVFNESLNIPTLYKSIVNVLENEDKFYLFVDDSSTDKTIETIQNCFSTTSFNIITKKNNLGPGDSFNRGFEWILGHSKNPTDLIVTLEGDNTSDITILPQMIKISGLGYDLVLASIYVQGGGFDKTSFFRKIISLIANMMLRFVFDIKVLTLSSFYRVYKIELIEKIKNEFNRIISENGFISMVEILIKSIKLKASIIEVPMMLYSAKRSGKSKMKIAKTTFAYLRLIFKKLIHDI